MKFCTLLFFCEKKTGLWAEAQQQQKKQTTTTTTIEHLILYSDKNYLYLNDGHLVNLLSLLQQSQHSVYLKV